MHTLFGVIASSIRTAVVTRFDSLYESFQALTSVQVSHFVEWFSGSALSSIWTTGGTGTISMQDAIDGGLNINTSDTGNGVYAHFNDKRHYSHNDSIVVLVAKVQAAANTVLDIGTINSATPAYTTEFSMMRADNNTSTLYRLGTADATTPSFTDSSVTIDTSFHSFKIENGSANIKLYIDGVLEVTKTTNRPTAKQQPLMRVFSRSGTVNADVLFYEIYNTSVSISSSLYERLSALTQVMKQRVVENFSGSGLQTDRWTLRHIAGSGSGAMQDTIDGGYGITTGTTTNDRSCIDFNLKRQYDYQNSEFIVVMKTSKTTTYWCIAGMKAATTSYSPDGYYVWNTSQSFTNFACGSYGSATGSNTASSVVQDTNWHTFKLAITSSNLKFYIDGVLEVTKTTNLPTQRLEPFCWSQTDAASAHTNYFRYVEAYNKLGTETDYPSVYELFNPLTTVAKTHFWDWFDGNDIDTTRWTKRDAVGTGAFAMQDAVDEGFQIDSGGSAGNRSMIDFNNKRQFNEDGFICIIVGKEQSTGSGAQSYLGMAGLLDNNTELAVMYQNAGTGFMTCTTADATTLSQTNTSVAFNYNWHSIKLEGTASNVKLWIDGVLEVTKTTNLPTDKLQPHVSSRNGGAVAQTRVRYFEAYNT